MKTVLELEDLATKAINAALSQEWPAAAALNQEILDEDDHNIEACNRLARSLAEQGLSKEAKKAYQRVLELDPYNTIAQKNLAKLELGTSSQPSRMVSSGAFLEEPGKTRTATLLEPTKKRLETLTPGQQLELEARAGRLVVVNPHGGALLGYLEDDLSSHLLNLIHLGNTYTVHFMGNSEGGQVFLREASQSETAAKFVSFSRNHSAAAAPSLAGTSLSADTFTAGNDDDVEGWEADSMSEESSESENSDDDFASMSLENMREEEDEESGYSGNSRDNY